MRTKLKLNLRATKKAIRTELQPRLTIAADELRDYLADELDGGALPIQTDTGALARSLSVKTPQGSDGAARIREAAAAYLSKDDSRWIGPIREYVTPFAYEKAHWAERVADDEPLPRLDGRPRAMIYTRVAYGLWWQMGHSNVFTGRYEKRDWMLGPPMEWAIRVLPDYFAGAIR